MSVALSTRPAAVRSENLLEPTWAEITAITPEVEGVSTFWLRFTDPAVQEAYSFRPGQFNMVYVPGVGEAAISISSNAHDTTVIGHSVRFVGNVTRAISRLKVGDTLGLRGPFGTSWPLEDLVGKDIFMAAGGIGLPPMRPVIYHILRNREKYGKVTLVYGARTPKELMYQEEYETWRQAGIDLELTVDRADPLGVDRGLLRLSDARIKIADGVEDSEVLGIFFGDLLVLNNGILQLALLDEFLGSAENLRFIEAESEHYWTPGGET